jgi:hypothetical protein
MNFHRTSANHFNSLHTKKLFQEQVMKEYPLWEGISWKEYTKYRPTRLDWENHTKDAVLSIHDSIRWCEASTLYEHVINMLKTLTEKGYWIDTAIFVISDGMERYVIEDAYGGFNVTITCDDSDEEKHEYYALQRVEHEDETEEKKYPYESRLVKVDKITDDEEEK